MDNKEVYTNKIQAGSRTYFFDIKKTKRGDLYFNITEARSFSSGFERHRIMVFDEDIDNFLKPSKSCQTN
jgi:hypothetical protein